MWFVYDPEQNGYEEFDSEKTALEHAERYIREYLEDGWNEEVTLVTIGKITHRASRCNYKQRPPADELDTENIDQEGDYWDDEWNHMCNYRMQPL